LVGYELKPTFDNLKDSILKDSVGRNKSIATFIELLDKIDNNVAIALDDSWGNRASRTNKKACCRHC
jgi:hypothetical protein